MAVVFKKKANKTPTSDEGETHKLVQETLDHIDKHRDEAVRNFSKK